MSKAIFAHRVRVLGPVAVTLLASLAAADCSRSEPASVARRTAQLSVKVLSGRADMVSGGDALVEVVLPSSASSDSVNAQLNGAALNGVFARRDNGLVMGLVTGLREGDNLLSVSTSAGTAQLTIVNYPNGGPIFSGPQIQPWPCLDGATDLQCNREVKYEYFYKSSASQPCTNSSATSGSNDSCLKAYDPENPPSDVAMTTTTEGKEVPYIVRRETGSQDRGQYQIAVLFDPTKDWAPWAPQDGWNGKTYVTGGSGCGTHHGEMAPPPVLSDMALSQGFMVWSTALDHNTSNCNLVVQAESLMMAKERIVENYGPIRYTIGSGCSGGSIYQQQAANDYPGIFDGILPTCSFPDSWTTAIEVTDCRFLVDYFDAPSRWAPGVQWSSAQQAAVEGHPGPNLCESWINVYAFDQGGNPRAVTSGLGLQSCNVPALPAGSDPSADYAYDPERNRIGVRCDLSTYFGNQLGPRPISRWSPIELELGHGFVQAPFDNIGVQYGLGALTAGTITPAQFVDLNQKVGGRTIDYDPTLDRVEADPFGIVVAYQGGLYNEGNNMHLPIIDLRGHDVAEIHHDYRSYVMRARLDKANGHHDNQVIWTGPAALVGDASFQSNALKVMDKWLGAIEADSSSVPLAVKVVSNKPAEAHDLCTDGNGNENPSRTACEAAFPYYKEPRMVAGEPFTGDVLKCQLKPIDRADYAGAIPPMTDAEFTALSELFPNGVCDYTKPGVGQQPTIPWMGYADGPGGKALGFIAP